MLGEFGDLFERSVSSLSAAWGLDWKSTLKRVQMLYLLTFLSEVGNGGGQIQLTRLYCPTTSRIASESVTDLHCCRVDSEIPYGEKFMIKNLLFKNMQLERFSQAS